MCSTFHGGGWNEAYRKVGWGLGRGYGGKEGYEGGGERCSCNKKIFVEVTSKLSCLTYLTTT